MTNQLSRIYSQRFNDTGFEKRSRVWKILCFNFFNKKMIETGSVLELASGYGEFINNINVDTKFAIDLNPDSFKYLEKNIIFKQNKADDLNHIENNSIDRVFTSNFLEHLPNKEACDNVLTEVLRVLKPGGKFIILGPNIKYLYAEYWDFYDHYLPLSHLSLGEGLIINGFELEEVIDRFLPYTMQSKIPSADFLIKIYLKFPFFWRFLGKQFLVTAVKPNK